MKYDKEYFRWLHKQKRAIREKELQKLVPTANSRLKSLEKKGYVKTAYKYVQKLRGDKEKPRFSRARKRPVVEINKELRMIEKFLLAETSTIKGYEEVDRKRRETLKKNNKNWTDNDVDRFFSLMEDESVRAGIKKGYYTSKDTIDSIESTLTNEKSAESIIELYDQYVNGEITWDGLNYELKKQL